MRADAVIKHDQEGHRKKYYAKGRGWRQCFLRKVISMGNVAWHGLSPQDGRIGFGARAGLRVSGGHGPGLPVVLAQVAAC
jgi:hypothetical protein